MSVLEVKNRNVVVAVEIKQLEMWCWRWWWWRRKLYKRVCLGKEGKALGTRLCLGLRYKRRYKALVSLMFTQVHRV